MRKQCIGIASFISAFCLARSAAHASSPSCDGKPPYTTTSCPDPGSNEVVVYGDANGTGKCFRIASNFVDPVNSPGVPPGYIPNLDNYGFGDCISSVKVGSNVRLLAFKNIYFDSFVLPLEPQEDLWALATYEPDALSPWYAEPTVNDDFSSLIVENIGQTNNERIPHRYIGSEPTEDDDAFWSNESQGICHNKTHWFITQEVSIYGSSPIGPDFLCVLLEKETGRLWKVPRDAHINGDVPPGSTYTELGNMPDGFNTYSGYRHFGDPDCQTISGKDYVFVPVQACASNTSGITPLPYVLVLDSDLNYVASWTIPPQPSNYDISGLASCLGVPLDANAYNNVMGHGMGSWVAVRPSSAMITSNVEVWMGTDICNGLGLMVFNGDLNVYGSMPMSLQTWAPVITDIFESPENFGAFGGGVFSPSGQTLYFATGDTDNLGGIRVISPDTGQEITKSGNGYGPFDYEHHLTTLGIPTGQETEGLDFLDTRCPGTPVASTGGQSSQLHVVMNHNGSIADQAELRHYSVGVNETTPMCDPMRFDSSSNPAISSQGGGTLDVFSIAGGRVFQRSYNAGWAPTWTPLPALESGRHLVGKPASVSWGPGRIDLFVHDDIGNIRHEWSNSGSWNPSWETIAATNLSCNLYPYSCNGLTVASWGPYRLDVFDTVPNGAGGTTIIQIIYANGWNPPRRPFGDSPPATWAISAVSWGPNRIDFVATPFSAGGAYQIGQYYSNDGWNFYGPYPLGGMGNFFTFPTNVALSSWAYSDIEVISMANSSTGSVIAQNGFRPGLGWVNWTTTAMADPNPVYPGTLSSTSSGNNRIDVVYSRPDPTGSTTSVWHVWYNNVSPVGWWGPEPL